MSSLRPTLLALALLAAAPATLAASPAAADAVDPSAASGTIVSIDTAQNVLVLSLEGHERRARFSPMTRVRVAGMPGAITDLRPGMRVVVHFAASATGREGTMLVAIDAWR